MAGQDRGGNEGFSGTPLWKLREQMAQYRSAVMASNEETQKVEIVPIEPPNVIVDTVSHGGPHNSNEKLVRSVLIKDLRKIASRLNIVLPNTNVFKDKASCGLYALFDGQSCAGEPGVRATEFCARNFHVKVLENLSQLPPNHATETFVKAALIKSFEDLDDDLLKAHPDVSDGCGAAVCLFIDNIAFTAVLGQCNAVICEAQTGQFLAKSLGGSQRDITSIEERARLKQVGVGVIGEGAMARLRHPSGALSPVGRSFGDAAWKSDAAVISCMPEVQSVTVRSPDAYPFLLLLSSSISVLFSPQQLIEFSREYPGKPRAACGQIIAQVVEAYPGANPMTQYSAIGVGFLPERPKQPEPELMPLLKKPKTNVGINKNMTSVRLRHILVRFADPQFPGRQVDGNGKQVTRTRTDAEMLLRRAIRDLAMELRLAKKTPKDVAEKVAMESKKFAELCREMSDCPTAKKGGAMCGDIGWMAIDALVKMGGNFKENVDALRPGEWSDITQSREGVHLIQKVA